MDVGILGAGRLAVAIAQVLGARGASVRIWARSAAAREMLGARPGVSLVSADIGEVAATAKLVVFAVPAPAIEEVAERYAPHARGDQVVLHASRGAGLGFRLPHQLIRARTCVRKIGALGGPLHAQELGSGRTLAAVLASRFEETIALVRRVTEGTSVRIHPSSDVIGVEVAGAISNVSALAAGMCEALQLGDTARGVLLTRGLAEAQRLGVALGASAATFSGLAGVGDLIPRKVSSTDRHHEIGARVAHGVPLSAALAGVEGCVEGIMTAREAVLRATKLGIDLPLVRAVDRVLRGETEAAAALEALLRMDFDLGEPRAALR